MKENDELFKLSMQIDKMNALKFELNEVSARIGKLGNEISQLDFYNDKKTNNLRNLSTLFTREQLKLIFELCTELDTEEWQEDTEKELTYKRNREEWATEIMKTIDRIWMYAPSEKEAK